MNRSPARFHTLDVSHALDHIHETFHISISDTADLFLAVGFSHVLDEAMARNTMYSLVQTMQEIILSGTQDVRQRFEEAVRKGNLYLEGRDIASMGKLHIAAGLLTGEEMHITKSGAAEMYLIRHGQCTNVTANFDEPLYDEDGNPLGSTVGELMDTLPDNEYFNNIATGMLTPGDILLIATARLTRHLDEHELSGFFGKSNLDVGFLNLEHRLKDDPDADVAILGLKMQVVTPETSKAGSSTPGSVAEESSPEPADFVGKVRHRARLVRGGLSDPEQRKKLYTLGAIVLGIVLIISITTALGNNQDAEFKLEVKQQFADAKNELTLARNSNIKGNREEARTHLEASRAIIADLQAKNVVSADVNALLSDVEKESDVANKVTRVGSDDPFINAEGQFSGEAIKGLVVSDNQLFVYSSSSIFGPFINGTTNANKKYTLETNDLILDLTPFSDIRGFLLKLTPDKIAEFSNNSYKFVDSTGITWKAGNFIDTFGSNVYVLGTDQIWRYTRNKEAYRGPSPWLQKAEPTLKDAVSFAVDGAVYTLMNNGEVKKFFRNKPVDLQIIDAPEEVLRGVDSQSKILTESDWRHVYIFNHAHNSVASLVKVQGKDQLAFDRQIIFEGAEVITVTLSPDEGILYGLTKEGKILRVEL
ncbi:hypothetical protein COW46_00135 [Candidatus Gracilibacteria bacterium CG17_big_fil_post_rev_8_21_14_2_50_48_13]|nr:MAG: hypothetical protein COW46_00135 [Candidatus Gracilibacteria bacterium CG17_big_fil_post_rev_8_21_14_2_50_48_13]